MVKYQTSTLKNGLTLITINLPHLSSVTTMIAVGAGSRYENKKINGISHFLEHMFFKGSSKYPNWEVIANTLDGIGAVHNAGTSKEWTYYWIKSSAEHLELSVDLLSSLIKDPLFNEEEIEKEKGAVIEELKMYRDDPARFVFDLYEELQYGDQPLGWDVGGTDKTVISFKRGDLFDYVNSLYSTENMVMILVGNLPENVKELVEKYTRDFPKRSQHKFEPYKKQNQTNPRVRVHFKKTDQAHLILGVEGLDRHDERRYAAKVLSTILGEGTSSRLFTQIRERRGWAYHISSDHDSYIDTGAFIVYCGLRLDKLEEGLVVIKEELEKVKKEKVSSDELKKAKEIIRGRLALRSESTNFLAEHFGVDFVLDKKLESFEEYLERIDAVSVDDVLKVASEILRFERFNLQIIGPFKSSSAFEKLLSNAKEDKI